MDWYRSIKIDRCKYVHACVRACVRVCVQAAEEAARKAKAEREEAEAKAAEEAAAAKAGAAVVQRRELRRMNRADQERCVIPWLLGSVR